MPSDSPTSDVKAVLFDYGLVLSGPPDPATWEAMKRILAADEAAFSAAYWGPRHDYDRGVLNGKTYWHEVAQHLGRQLTPEQHQRLIDADTALWTQPNQSMIDWAAQLQAAGIRTGILSNIGDAMEEGVLARCGWLSSFFHLTFSHRLLMAKPEAAIYTHAIEGMRVPPHQLLFVDDREENIRAAREAGMQAIQYTNHDEFVLAMHQAGLEALLTPATNV